MSRWEPIDSVEDFDEEILARDCYGDERLTFFDYGWRYYNWSGNVVDWDPIEWLP